MSRWWRRLAGGLVAFAGLQIGLSLARMEPDPVRVALLVAACIAVLGLIVDTGGDPGPSWEVVEVPPAGNDAGDARLTRAVALLEAHRTSRAPDAALRDRLAVLADQVLRQRYGMTRRDPRAAELLGPELNAVVNGPPRRLELAEINRCLTRIEEL